MFLKNLSQTLTLCVLAATIGACGKESPTAPTTTPTPPVACEFMVGDAPLTPVASEGADFTISITTTAGCAWTAASGSTFLKPASAAAGTGTGSVKFAAEPNDGGSRQGTVQVAGRTLTVLQAGAPTAPCEFAVNPAVATVVASGAELTVDILVASGADCSWTATSDSSYISISSAASGTGNGKVVLSVAANMGTARVGIVTIAGRTVTLTQDAPGASPCMFTVSPAELNFTATGGYESVAVTPTQGTNCSWTAVPSPFFVTINGDASGVGFGRFTINVTPNPGGFRSGTVVVGGRTVTVKQAASPASGTIAVLSYQSDVGDLAGNGETHTYTLRGSEVQVSLDAAQANLEVVMPRAGPMTRNWRLVMAAPAGQQLRPGLYEHVAREAFKEPGQPGLSFAEGTGCNKLTGRFLITEAVYGPGNTVQRFHARFQQHCDGWSVALHGQIWIDASGAAPGVLAPFPPPPSTPGTRFSYVSDPGTPAERSETITLSGMRFLAWSNDERASVDIHINSTQGPYTSWIFRFGAPSGPRLQAGTYTGAIEYPFTSGVPVLSLPGLNVNGCAPLTGSFVVFDVVYGPKGEVERFHATFEQHCPGLVPAVRGEIRIAADPWR